MTIATPVPAGVRSAPMIEAAPRPPTPYERYLAGDPTLSLPRFTRHLLRTRALQEGRTDR